MSDKNEKDDIEIKPAETEQGADDAIAGVQNDSADESVSDGEKTAETEQAVDDAIAGVRNDSADESVSDGEKTAETEQAVDDAVSEEQNDSADESLSDDGSKEKAQKKQLIWEIVSCVIAVAAIIVAMILVIKSKEKEVQITHLYERAATIYDPGNIDCWYNVTTGRYYSDKKCKEEISEDEALTYFFDRELSGVVQSGVKHYYVTGGTADRSFNGFAKDENDDWYYFENGISYENADDVVKGTVNGEDGWWCIRGGKVAFVDTVAENVNGMWYIKNGKVLFEDAIAESETGSWYCKGGKVDYDYNGKYEYNGKTYKIENGKVVKVY